MTTATAEPTAPPSSSSRPAPTPREAPFGIDELFFSTTDGKGIITSGNDVFMRVSGYAREDLVGRAHNAVRHPDMPRAAFKIFWEYLEDSKPVAAYVKNIAADGSYYWVMAVAVPVENGFVSVRLKPSSELFAQVQSIYAEVRELEIEVEGGDPRMRKESIERGKQRLLELLAEAGFESYDAFMHAALPMEVVAREQILGARTGPLSARRDATLTPMLEAVAATHSVLETMLLNSERYAALKETLPDKGRFVLNLSAEIRLFSLNARLVAARLDERGAAMGAIASLMRGRSDNAEPVIRDLNAQIEATLEQLDDLGFRIAASKLRAEMLAVFIRESLAGGDPGYDIRPDLHVLAASLHEGVELMFGMAGLDSTLEALDDRVGELRKNLRELGVLELYGRVESTRVADAGTHANVLFQSIGRHVTAAQGEMNELHEATGAIRFSDKDTAKVRRSASRLVELSAT